jgi:hypothetical protein
MNQIAVQYNYLLKQIYICGGNVFRLLSASHHQALHSFQTVSYSTSLDFGLDIV